MQEQTKDELFTQNKTMRKLAHLLAISATSPEGHEITELIQALSKHGNVAAGGYSDAYMLASFAYSLGIVKGKQTERARRKQTA